MIKKLLIFSLLVIFANVYAVEEEFSPWDAWRKGYSFYEDGEKHKAKNQNAEALKKYLESRDCYLAVKKARPDWNQQIIDNRIKMCNREIDALRKRIDQHASAEQALPPPLQSGKTVSSDEIMSGRGNIYELQIELDKYKKRFRENLEELEKLRHESERNRSSQLEIANLVKEKAVLGQKLDSLQQKYDVLLEKHSSPDKEKENIQNRLVEERMKLEIVSQRMKILDEEHSKLKNEIGGLLQERRDLQQKNTAIEAQNTALSRQLEDQNKLAKIRNNETASLRKELANQQEEYKLLNLKLTAAQDEIKRLSESADGKNSTSQQLAENNVLSRRLSEATIENTKMRGEKLELSKKLDEQGNELKELRLALLTMTDQRDSLKKSIQNFQAQSRNYAEKEVLRLQEIESLKNRNIQIDNELQSYITKYQAVQKRLETRLDSEYQNTLSLTNQVKSGLEKLKERDDELKLLQRRYSESQESHRRLTDTIQELKDKLIVKNDESSKLSSVSEEYRKLQEEHKRLVEELNSLKKINQANSDIAAKYQVATQQLEQMTKHKTDLDILKIKYKQAQEQLEQAKKITAGTDTAQYNNLRDELQRTTEVLKKTEIKNVEYEQKISEQSILLADTQKMLKNNLELRQKLSNELSKVNTELDENRNNSIRYNRLVSEYKVLEKQKKETALLLDKSEKSRNEMATDIAKKEKIISELINRFEPDEDLIKKISTKPSIIQNELSVERERNSNLKKQLDNMQKDHLATIKKLQQLTEDFNTDKVKLTNLDKETTRLKNELAAKELRITALLNENGLLKKTAEGFAAQRKELENLRAGFESQKSDIARSRTDVVNDDLLQRQLSAASEIYRRQLNERDQRLNIMEQQLVVTRKNSEQLQKNLAEMQNKLNLLESIRKSEIAAIENFNRSLSTDLALIPDNRPAKSAEEIAWHAAELLTVGENAEREQEFDVAMWNYRKILEFDPPNYQANARLGSICYKKGMYNDAARYFHTALKNDLKNPNVALDYGLCLIELNDYSAAQKILADAVAQYPDNDDLRIVNAATINYCGDSEKAITELQKLHARMPERTDIMLYLAEAFYDSGEQLDKASNLYRKARKLGASPSPKLEKLGGVDNEEKALLFLYNSAKESEKNGDQLSAIWYYDQILKLEGEKSKIANHLGILQLKNNRPEDVLKNLRNRNNDLNAQILCGIASVMIDKYLDAAAFFRISQRMKINNNNLLINPEVDALARNTVQNMSAKNNADQTIQAALEALNNLLER